MAARTDSYGAVFVRHDRAERAPQKSLTPRSIQRVLEHYRHQANITKRLTPSTLRHTFAARLLAAGADPTTVSATLGHRHKNTLKLYHYQTAYHSQAAAR